MCSEARVYQRRASSSNCTNLLLSVPQHFLKKERRAPQDIVKHTEASYIQLNVLIVSSVAIVAMILHSIT